MNGTYSSKTIKKNLYLFTFASVLLFLFSSLVFAQNLPDKIRGYKVYRAKISIKNQTNKSSDTSQTATKENSEASIKVGEPEIVDISLTGVTLELSAEINALEQSGTIDFLAFKDFRVNNLAVKIEEYKESFSIEKNQPVILPKPIKIFIGTGETLRGALKEWMDSKDEWTITGTVFVFGRFKKSFLKFKRVVPVAVNIKIKNPIAASADTTYSITSHHLIF